ncbi:MAG: DUF4394 domain-containing protein [Luteimonas sp.]
MQHSRLISILVATALSSAISVAVAASPQLAAGFNPAATAQALPTACDGGGPLSRGIFAALSLRMVGLTADGRLVCFRERTPQIVTSLGFVSGLVTDTSVVGIDYRVQDGLLYAVGNAGGVYLLNTATAAATLVNRLSVAMDGTAFGVDFNPAADRLRIVSNTGQNLRHNVNSGGVTLTDTALAYTVGMPATAVTGAAYTNNDLDANTATSIFDIDTALDQVVLQSPANGGTLAATGRLTVDAQAAVGMDIYSTIIAGVTVANRAYAALTPLGGTSSLYAVELTTGKATLRGAFATDNHIVDIAIPQAQ